MFKAGTRASPIMQSVARGLSDADSHELALYFAGTRGTSVLAAAPPPVDLVTAGQELFPPVYSGFNGAGVRLYFVFICDYVAGRTEARRFCEHRQLVTQLRESAMFIFSVRNLCVSSQAAAVLEAVNHVDANAVVSINLSAHEVRIAPTYAGATELSDAIARAGFDHELIDCKSTVRGRRQTPPKIPFEGFDHDFSVSAEVPEERTPVSIAGASRVNNLLSAEALGLLAH